METMRQENQGLRQEMEELHQKVCSTSFSMDEIKACLESQISKPEEFLETPSHLKLVSEYEAMVDKRYCNTIIVIGPKGCGKTSSARMLHKSLLDQGKKAAYLDVATVRDSSREYMMEVLVELRRQGVETLIIDNAEAIDLYPTIYRFEFVLAVFSPGATAMEKIPSFIKKRGNGNSTRVYFRPLSMEWCEKLLEKFGCQVQKEDKKKETAAQVDKSTLPLKQLNHQQFLNILNDVGGVPRYLQYCVRYGVKEGCKKVDEELVDHLRLLVSKPDLLKKWKEYKTCTSRVNEMVMCGIVYVDDNDVGQLVSPRCDYYYW